jgi:hypothetical protein
VSYERGLGRAERAVLEQSRKDVSGRDGTRMDVIEHDIHEHSGNGPGDDARPGVRVRKSLKVGDLVIALAFCQTTAMLPSRASLRYPFIKNTGRWNEEKHS